MAVLLTEAVFCERDLLDTVDTPDELQMVIIFSGACVEVLLFPTVLLCVDTSLQVVAVTLTTGMSVTVTPEDGTT